MWILSHAFFAETFQPMNAAVTFQIGLKDSARAIRGKLTFAGARESCWVIRTMYTSIASSVNYLRASGTLVRIVSARRRPLAATDEGTWQQVHIWKLDNVICPVTIKQNITYGNSRQILYTIIDFCWGLLGTM